MREKELDIHALVRNPTDHKVERNTYEVVCLASKYPDGKIVDVEYVAEGMHEVFSEKNTK